MSCNQCKHAMYQDTGYSNYTVEGTDFTCALKQNPVEVFDRFYGKAFELQYGDNCPVKEPGEPLEMDVEGENYATFTDEEKAIWNALTW